MIRAKAVAVPRVAPEAMLPISTPVSIVRPPLKWAGGKRWQVPFLRPLWEPHRHRRLVEPFCGGLAVATGLMPRTALLNDINVHLINFYRHLKSGFTPTSKMRNDKEHYYTARNRFNELLRLRKGSSEEAATLFYYLNRTGYNGLCRFNSKGYFNVPFGRYAKIEYRDDFEIYKYAFSEWDFTNNYFDRVDVSDDDFIYADPPYDVDFRQYSRGGFDWDEQKRLAEWLAQHRGPVILVNQATQRIVELYTSLGYELVYLKGPRRISCTGNRSPAPEVLATRNL